MYKCEIEGCDWTGMIRSKVKNRDSEFYGKKVCPNHAQQYNVYLAPRPPALKRTPIKSSRKRIKPITEKTRQKKKEQSEIRNEYFEYHLLRCERSLESGQPIPNPTRANICHIFPKRLYKSVQANVENCIYLTLSEHTRFDQLLDTNNFKQLEQEFKCWDTVLKRIKFLLPQVKENGKLKTLLEEYINEQ